MNIEELKDKFVELLEDTNRPGIGKVLEGLETVGFYKAPASSRFHCAYEGGLLELRPALPTLAHELYHAIRNSARNFGFEQSRHDEAEAYLFERAFEYFAPMSAEWRKPRR